MGEGCEKGAKGGAGGTARRWLPKGRWWAAGRAAAAPAAHKVVERRKEVKGCFAARHLTAPFGGALRESLHTGVVWGAGAGSAGGSDEGGARF